MLRYAVTIILLITSLTACRERKTEAPRPLPIRYKQDTAISRVVLNIADSFMPRLLVVYISDSAHNTAGLNRKMNNLFSQTFPKFMKNNGLDSAGPPMAWFITNEAPFYFEVGLPINRKAVVGNKKLRYRYVGGDSAVVARFFGPYSGTQVAYQALQEYCKRKRRRHSKPYEIYVGKPFDEHGKPINPYKVETDVVFPLLR